VCACHPNKAAMYRQHAERIRAIAQQVPLAETKVLLLKAALHLEERAQDEERRAQKLPLNPAPRTRDE
jgi:formate dehydrogenase maturation protein FdhE